MTPIVVCTVHEKCVPVLKKSVETYCPGVEVLITKNEPSTFGEAYNAALYAAFEEYDEVIVANDDIVLTPWSYQLLLDDVEALKKEHGDMLGFVAAHADSAAHRQNVRYQNGSENTLSAYDNKWDWEKECRPSDIVAPIFAWISKKAFYAAQFPPTNWYSDDVICLDLNGLGYKHFISRSYVHHVGSQTVGQNWAELNQEAFGWLCLNRTDYAFGWFGHEKVFNYLSEKVRKPSIAEKAAPLIEAPQPLRKPKICVYAISKNEEHFIERFYNSAKDADIVLIADTGSTDNTIAEAKRVGADVYSICITPWRFDHARNAALALVPPDVDICVSIDIDEVLVEGWREEIERVWTPGATRLRYLYDWGNSLQFWYEKIHARHGYHWHHPCHEYPRPDGRVPEVWVQSDKLLVTHHPDPTKSRGQYIDLLELSVKEDPHCPRNAFYYARELYFHHRYEQSIEALKRYLDMPSATWDHERCYAMRVMGECYEGLKQSDEAEKCYHRAVAEAPHTREPWCALATLYYNQGRWPECYAASQRALSIQNRELVYTSETASWGAKPHDLSAISAWHIGLLDKAIEHGKIAIELDPGDDRLKENMKWFLGEKKL